MQFANEGLRIWYDTPDAPIGNESVMVGVSPSHIANAVSLRYRINGGPARTTQGRVLESSPVDTRQYFRVDLPKGGQGDVVEVAPVLTCSGRQAPGADKLAPGGAAWVRFDREAAPSVQPTPIETRPKGPMFNQELEFLGTVRVTLSEPETIGPTPQGLRKNFYITSGSCKGPKLNALVRSEGADWLLIQPNGVGLPSVRTTWETPDGAVLYGDYSGTLDFGPDGYENALREKFPDFVAVQLTPRFVTSHRNYLWLNRLQCIGIGVVDMKKLLVEYDLHALKAAQRRA